MDPYAILGIDNCATRGQIDAAYREKAKKHHPDVGGDAWAFQVVQQAYEAIIGGTLGANTARRHPGNGESSDGRSAQGSNGQARRQRQERPAARPVEGAQTPLSKTIVGLGFCLILGICIASQGWTALFWAPAGLIFGLFATAHIVLPIILDLPRAIALVVKRRMRPAVVSEITLTSLIWFLSPAAAGLFWPAAADYLYSNLAFSLSASFGMIATILSPLSKKWRADFRQDFDRAYRRFYSVDFRTACEAEERSTHSSQHETAHDARREDTTSRQSDKGTSPLGDYRSDVSDAEALIARGVAKRESGDYAAAIHDFDDAIELQPTSTTAYLERSNAKRQLGDVRGAAEDMGTFRVMLDRLEEGLKANDAAAAAYESDDYVAAVRNYNKAISLAPSLTCAYYHRGLAKLCLEDYKGAAEDFSKSIRGNASNMCDAYHQRGKIKHHTLNDMIGAMQDFDAAIALRPNDADILFSRALIATEYEALEDLDRAIELSPTSAKLFSCRAIKRYEMGDVDGAIQDLTQYIELEPTDIDMSVSDAYSLRGSMKAGKLDYASALADHNQAIELNSSRAGAYFDRGFAQYGLRDYEGAIRDFSQAIALEPSNALAYEFRGLARVEVGLQTEADRDFSEARSLGYREEAE